MPVPSNFVSQYTVSQGRQVSVRFTYADAAARNSDTRTDGPSSMAAEALSSNDIGAIAIQLDDPLSFYILSDHTVPTWLQFPSTGTGAANTTVLACRKASAGTVSVGEAVYITGFDTPNSAFLVEFAQSDAASTMPAIGLAAASFTDSTNGNVVLVGNLDGFDTSSFALEDELYVSDSVPGGLTTTRPTGAGDRIQLIATVALVNASTGRVVVHHQGHANNFPQLTQDNILIGDANNAPAEATEITDTLHGDRGGGSLHALAIASGAAGFMSGADKTKLDGLTAGTGGWLESWSWTFDPASITDADPGPGVAKLDNATQASALFMFIDDDATNGATQRAALLRMHKGQHFTFQEVATAANFHVFRVTGDPIAATGYVKIPLVVIDSGVDLTANLCGFAGQNSDIINGSIGLVRTAQYTLSTSPAQVLFDTALVQNTDYFSFASSEVTILKAARYFLTAEFTADITSGSTTALATIQIYEDVGAGFVAIPEAISHERCHNTATPEQHPSIAIPRDFVVGDIIRVYTWKAFGTATAVSIANHNRFNIVAQELP